MSERRPPTASQWAAIEAVDQHVLVAAGAGTGKTTTVVNRILWLLGVEFEGRRCPAPHGLRDIAAISYTNAAAADLKRQLREALRAVGLRQVAFEVDTARIGTIHGFCGDLLREFALRAGRSPALRVLEEGESTALVAEAVHDTVVEAIEREAVAGLGALFERADATAVEGWVAELAADASRLEAIRQHREAHPELERTLVDLACLARDGIRDRLERAGAVDFDRMIVWTRDLLAGDPGIRAAIRRRIRTLVVDEFQDVDPIQREIAYLLGDPEARDPATTRLMLVGDPKQSIYRFRRADVTVWRQVERDFTERGLGRVLPLTDNFRSLPPILGFVEATVGRLLDQPIDGAALQPFEVPFLPVDPCRQPAPPEAAPAVELLLAEPPDDEKVKVDVLRAAEARAIAARALELREAGTPWKDMALLLPGWGSLELYESALLATGVPTYALRTEGFLERREVLDLLLALQVLRDPADDLALTGFLRGPCIGVRDETLLALARARRRSFHAALTEVECAETPLLRWAAALIAELAPLRDRIPAAELLQLLLDRTGYLVHLLLSGEPGRRAVANVRKLVGLAREHRAGGLGDFLRMVKEVRRRGDRVGEARLFGAQDEVVTITSIHSAKGLEWKVVFWADLGRGLPTEHGASLLVGRERMALKDPERETKDQDPAYLELLAAEQAEALAERKRLWYVAATRAKDLLVVSGLRTGDQPKGSAAEQLLPLLQREASDRFRFHARAGDFEGAVRRVGLEEPPADAPATAPPPVEIPEPREPLAVPPGRGRHSATELMLHARCPRKRWLRYVAGLREPPVDRGGGAFLGAVARGSLVHDVLEHAREGLDYEAELEAAIGRWDPGAPPPDAAAGQGYRERLRAEIDGILSDPGYRALSEVAGARRELPFLYLLGPGVALEGAMDLVAWRGGGYAILDVKTGAADAAAAQRKARWYEPQRQAYVSALAAISGRPVAEFSFYFSGTGQQVTEAVSPADVPQAAAAIRDRVERMRAGDAALTDRPEECAFCGYRTVGWCPGAG